MSVRATPMTCGTTTNGTRPRARMGFDGVRLSVEWARIEPRSRPDRRLGPRRATPRSRATRTSLGLGVTVVDRRRGVARVARSRGVAPAVGRATRAWNTRSAWCSLSTRRAASCSSPIPSDSSTATCIRVRRRGDAARGSTPSLRARRSTHQRDLRDDPLVGPKIVASTSEVSAGSTCRRSAPPFEGLRRTVRPLARARTRSDQGRRTVA